VLFGRNSDFTSVLQLLRLRPQSLLSALWL
jgi:hypothetical protein